MDHVTFTAMLQDVGNYLTFARDTLAIIGVIYTTKLVLSFAVKTCSAMRTYVVPRYTLFYYILFKVAFSDRNLWCLIDTPPPPFPFPLL